MDDWWRASKKCIDSRSIPRSNTTKRFSGNYYHREARAARSKSNELHVGENIGRLHHFKTTLVPGYLDSIIILSPPYDLTVQSVYRFRKAKTNSSWSFGKLWKEGSLEAHSEKFRKLILNHSVDSLDRADSLPVVVNLSTTQFMNIFTRCQLLQGLAVGIGAFWTRTLVNFYRCSKLKSTKIEDCKPQIQVDFLNLQEIDFLPRMMKTTSTIWMTL